MKEEEIEYRIKELILDLLQLKIEPEDIDKDQSLLQGSLGLDSTLTLELICGLEDEFGIEILDEELGIELFYSIASLTNYMKKKLTAKE